MGFPYRLCSSTSVGDFGQDPLRNVSPAGLQLPHCLRIFLCTPTASTKESTVLTSLGPTCKEGEAVDLACQREAWKKNLFMSLVLFVLVSVSLSVSLSCPSISIFNSFCRSSFHLSFVHHSSQLVLVYRHGYIVSSINHKDLGTASVGGGGGGAYAKNT